MTNIGNVSIFSNLNKSFPWLFFFSFHRQFTWSFEPTEFLENDYWPEYCTLFSTISYMLRSRKIVMDARRKRVVRFLPSVLPQRANKDNNVPVPRAETWCKNVYNIVTTVITDKNKHALHFVLYKNFSWTELDVLNFVDDLSFECS